MVKRLFVIILEIGISGEVCRLVIFHSLGVSLGDLPPRTTIRAFLDAGLHVRTSPYKKFWKNTFFVIDFQIGKSIYVEPKPDQFSSTDGIRPSGHIGLHYLFPRKK